MNVTRVMLVQRLEELRNAQLEALSAASTILGRIQECELLLTVLDKEGVEAEVLPSPTPQLVEDEVSEEG